MGLVTEEVAQETAVDSKPAPTDAPKVEIPEFLRGIDPELAKDPSIQSYKDMNSLVKSLIHAQKTVGKDKLVKPTAKSSKEEWDSFYKAIGRPEKAEEYGLTAEGSKVDADILKMLVEEGHKLNLLPGQMKGIVETVKGIQEKVSLSSHQKLENTLKESLDGLKKEWGSNYDKEMFYAQSAVKEFLTDEEKKYLADTKMEYDPTLIKMFNKIGKSLGDDKFKGEGMDSVNSSADQLDEQIATLSKDPAYFDKSNPDHKRIVTQVGKLIERKLKKEK